MVDVVSGRRCRRHVAIGDVAHMRSIGGAPGVEVRRGVGHGDQRAPPSWSNTWSPPDDLVEIVRAASDTIVSGCGSAAVTSTTR